MQLWDALTPTERRQYISDRLTPGRVAVAYCDFTTPRKNKFLAIVCRFPRSLFFVINSSINEFVRKREHLHRCQVMVNQWEHEFLVHDSCLDCSEAHDLDLEDVMDQITSDVDRLKGTLSPTTVEQLLAAVKFAPTIAARDKA